MNDDNPPGRSGGGPPGRPGLRLLAMLTVLAGVLALAAAAFVFSYAPVYDIARAAGVRPGLARFYPAVPDAVLVVACAAALALRGARWWPRWLVWMSIIALVALVGAADAAHAVAYKLPRRPTAAAVAVLPWALLLLGFRLWLSVLRHTRKDQRPATGPAAADAAPAGSAADVADHEKAAGLGGPDPGTGTATTSPVVSQAGDGESAGNQATPAHGLDLILPPYPDEPFPGQEPEHAGQAPEPEHASEAPAPAAMLAAPVPDVPQGDVERAAASGPGTPEPQAVPVPAREPDAATDFQRVRSSPVPPDEPAPPDE